jgi:hypothetical protein
MRISINERENILSTHSAKLRGMEDGLARARKEAEQQAQEWKRMAANNSQGKGDGELQHLKVRHNLGRNLKQVSYNLTETASLLDLHDAVPEYRHHKVHA